MCFQMAESRKKKSQEIPITFGSNIRYIKGVTKYTTCTDIVKMVLRKLDDEKENGGPEAFGIYESSRGIERLLPGKSRLLKVMRSWGMDNNYEFVFRKVNPGFVIPKMSESKRRKLIKRRDTGSKSSTPAKKCNTSRYSHPNEFVKELYFNEDFDSSMEEVLPNTVQKCTMGIRDIRSTVTSEHSNKLSSVSTFGISRNVTGQSHENNMVYSQSAVPKPDVNNVKYAVKKSLKPKSCKLSGSESSLDDISSSSAKSSHRGPLESSNIVRKSAKEVHRTVKRHEKLATEIVNKIGRLNHKAGKEAILKKYFADYIIYRSPRYNYHDSRFRERGDGADSDDDDNHNVSHRGIDTGFRSTPVRRPQTATATLSLDDTDSGHDDEMVSFDTAFIGEPVRHVEIEAENNINAVNDLNDCITNVNNVGKLVDYSLSEDSILSDPSDISTVSENVHNVSSVSNIVKAVFNENRSSSEDDEMESFMVTKLEDDFHELSDEGLSSLGSDDEREILV